jgi:O-antigen/teichoic acid export membrane protein
MAVIRASAIAAVAHGLRMLANLVILKLIAVFFGPTGLGLLGNLMSITTMASVFAGGGIGSGITKYVAQYQHRPIRRTRFIGSAITYGMTFSLFILALTIIAARPLSIAILGNPEQIWLMPCIGVAQLLCFIGTASISVANGLQRSDIFAIISISAYVGVIPLAYLLIVSMGMAGAAIALLATISCTAFPAICYITKSASPSMFRFRVAKGDLGNLIRFSIMLLASAVFFPSAEIFIRNQIIAQLGFDQAGIWQALNRLSGAYLGFFTIFLSTHYMPRLSSLQKIKDLLDEVRRYLFGVGLAFLGFAFIVYMMRDYIIKLLFSSAFLAMGDLILVQLFGDFFRLLSYVIGFLCVAKAAVKLYVAAEIIQTGLYVTFSWLALKNGSVIDGIVYGYVLTYMLYFVSSLISLYVYTKKCR